MSHLRQSDQAAMERNAGLIIGDRASCAECGRFLIYTDSGWRHAGVNQPRHRAIPTDPPPGGVWVGDAPEDEPQPVPPVRTIPATLIINPPEDEPLSTWLPTSIRLDANVTPQTATYLLRTTYTAEWIAELRVCLSRTEDTESNQ